MEDSIIFGNLTADPALPCSEGQIIYNGPEHMLKFCNGTAWVNVTRGGGTITIIGILCGSSNNTSFNTAPTTNLCIEVANQTIQKHPDQCNFSFLQLK